MAKPIPAHIISLADQMEAAVNADGAVATVSEDFAKTHLPEGLTWEAVESTLGYRDDLAAATHAVAGRLLVKAINTDPTTATQVAVSTSFHRDTINSTVHATKVNSAGPKAEDPTAKVTTYGSGRLHITTHAKADANLSSVEAANRAAIAAALKIGN